MRGATGGYRRNTGAAQNIEGKSGNFRQSSPPWQHWKGALKSPKAHGLDGLTALGLPHKHEVKPGSSIWT